MHIFRNLKKPIWSVNLDQTALETTCGSTTEIVREPSSGAEAWNKSKSEATAEDLALVLGRGVRTKGF